MSDNNETNYENKTRQNVCRCGNNTATTLKNKNQIQSSDQCNCQTTDQCNCQTTDQCDCQTTDQYDCQKSNQCNCQKSNQCSCSDERNTKTQQSVNSENGKLTEADLQEVYKNASTGKESVEILRSFSSNKGFRNVLIKEYKEYATLAKEIELYANQVGYKLEKTSMMAKGMMYITTAVNTLKDKSDSKLGEIMIQGINMGIIAMTKLINKLSEKNTSCSFAQTLLDLLNKNLEEMKMFL